MKIFAVLLISAVCLQATIAQDASAANTNAITTIDQLLTDPDVPAEVISGFVQKYCEPCGCNGRCGCAIGSATGKTELTFFGNRPSFCPDCRIECLFRLICNPPLKVCQAADYQTFVEQFL